MASQPLVSPLLSDEQQKALDMAMNAYIAWISTAGGMRIVIAIADTKADKLDHETDHVNGLMLWTITLAFVGWLFAYLMKHYTFL